MEYEGLGKRTQDYIATGRMPYGGNRTLPNGGGFQPVEGIEIVYDPNNWFGRSVYNYDGNLVSDVGFFMVTEEEQRIGIAFAALGASADLEVSYMNFQVTRLA
jgi:hypothetical protein